MMPESKGLNPYRACTKMEENEIASVCLPIRPNVLSPLLYFLLF